MKKLIFLIAILFTSVLYAQDYIVRNCRDTVRCTIIKVGKQKISILISGVSYSKSLSEIVCYKQGNSTYDVKKENDKFIITKRKR